VCFDEEMREFLCLLKNRTLTGKTSSAREKQQLQRPFWPKKKMTAKSKGRGEEQGRGKGKETNELQSH